MALRMTWILCRCRHNLHLIGHCKGVLELHPTQQSWAGEVITVLREAAAAVTEPGFTAWIGTESVS
jgi:hypothetical protein